MRIIVNGRQHEGDAATLDALMHELDLSGNWYATARNGEFVPAASRAKTALQDGDRIEVLSPMQGG